MENRYKNRYTLYENRYKNSYTPHENRYENLTLCKSECFCVIKEAPLTKSTTIAQHERSYKNRYKAAENRYKNRYKVN